jgi:hypothetical protein
MQMPVVNSKETPKEMMKNPQVLLCVCSSRPILGNIAQQVGSVYHGRNKPSTALLHQPLEQDA